MAQDNLTAVLYGINDMRLEQRPIPVPNDDQVLIQMEVVGICGSDVHYLVHGRIADFVVEKPMIIGHEASGTVVEVGKNVTNLKKGDRVAIEPGVPCRTCLHCRTGYYNLCDKMVFCATPPVDGNLSRFYVHDADYCHKLPCGMDFEDGTLMEPLAVGVHACRKADVKIGDNCFIAGSGTIGLVCLLAAKAMGATKVIMTDLLDNRLELAKTLGADFTINVTNVSEEDTVKKIKELLGDEPISSFDCVGCTNSLRTCAQVTKTSGNVILIGMHEDEMKIPITFTLIREIKFKPIFRYCNDYPMAIKMVKTGKINPKPLVTHRFKLEESLKAFQTAITQEGNPVKIMINCNPNWQPK